MSLTPCKGLLTAPIPVPPPVITTILPRWEFSSLSGKRMSGTLRWIFFVSWKGSVKARDGSLLSLLMVDVYATVQASVRTQELLL
jgi:hypothetical protein